MIKMLLNIFPKKTFCFFIILLLTFSPSFSQQTKLSKADSLLNILKSAADDTSKVNLLNDIFKEYQDDNPAKALVYSKQALELAVKTGFQRGIASAYNNIGLAYFNLNKTNDALDNYLHALEIFNDIGYKKGSSISLANIGYLFYSQGNYPKTIEYYSQSLSLAQESGDKQRSASLLGNIGIVYYDQGYYAKALSYYMNSLSIYEEIKENQGIAYALGNIGLIYEAQENYSKSLEYYGRSLKIQQEIPDKKGIATTYNNIGDIYNTLKNYSKAQEYFQHALSISTEIDYKKVIASSLNNIGDVYKKQGKYSKASEYYTKTIPIYQEMNNKLGISSSYNNIGEIYRITGNTDNALIYFNLSLEVAREIGFKELMKENYQKIAQTYAAKKDYLEAYMYHQLYSDIKDSIYNEESIKQIADMQAKYETAQKEKEIKLLKKDAEVQNLKYNQNVILMYSLISVFLLLGVLTLFIFNNYRHRQRVKQLNAEIALRESEEKYRDLANLLPQIMFEVDKSNNLTFINTAGLAMTGYFIEDIMDGLIITEIFAHDEKEKLLENLKDIYSGIEPKDQEYSVKRKDGTNFPVLCYFSPFVDQHKNNGLRGIAMDITEHKQIERRILTSIIEAEEKERKRVAKDLHDGLGPLLSSIKLYVNELQSTDTDDNEKKEMLKYTNELIDDAVSSTRTIANNLMPSVIKDYGLVKALHSFCNKLNVAKSVNISFNTKDESRRYDKTIEITLYRVLMELINNSIKHASAKNIGITFSEENNLLNILFNDDGIGFDVDQTLRDPNIGMGLNNIINRVKSLQGTCEFDSKVGKGIVVKIEIDLKQFVGK
jgi:PAS domain S-box-containing protein